MPQPLDWAKLAYTYPRVVLMSRATLLLGGPSAFYSAQLAKAWPLRELPAQFAAAVKGCSGRKRAPAALAEPEVKAAKINDDDESSEDDASVA